jgi:hypothetical protein
MVKFKLFVMQPKKLKTLLVFLSVILIYPFGAEVLAQNSIVQTDKFNPLTLPVEGLGNAMDGTSDYFIVGARGTYVLILSGGLPKGGTNAGTCHIFKRNGTSWTLLKDILASDISAGDLFGESVAISSNMAIIGASGNDDGGSSSGSAYILSKDIGGIDNWGEQKKLVASDAQAGDFFGGGVALSGDYAIVGARGDDDMGSSAGAAYIFNRNQGGNDNWGQVKKITAPDGFTNNAFGNVVKVVGNIAIIGVPQSSSSAGAVYVYYKDAGGTDNWGFVKKLTAMESSNGFGQTISCDGNVLVVGTYSKACYVFSKDQDGADQWGLVKKLINPKPQTNDSFGSSVNISGDDILVGAPGYARVATNSGNVFRFSKDTGGTNNWGVAQEIYGSNNKLNSNFGSVIVSSGPSYFVLSLGEQFVYAFKGISSAGNTSPVISGITEININDNAASNPFNGFSIQDFDVPSQNIKATLILETPAIGTLTGSFTSHGSGTYSFYGTASQLTTALQQLSLTPQSNLVIPGSNTQCNVNLTIDDERAIPVQYITSIKLHSINNPPAIANKLIDVPLQSTVGFVVGTVTATDPDVGQSLHFSIDGGNDGNAFTINAMNQIVVNTTFQPFIKSQYDLLIKAEDSGNQALSSIATFTIFVVDETTHIKIKDVVGTSKYFGSTSAVDGNIALISEPYSSQGPVRIFYRDQDMWTLVKLIDPPASGISFGYGLAIHNDLIFIGAVGDSEIASASGAIFIFKKNLGGTDNWGLVKKLKAPDANSNDLFAYSLSIHENMLLVGATGVDYSGGIDKGAVYFFEKDNGGIDNWGMLTKFTLPSLDPSDKFGEQVSLFNNQMVVVASGDDDAGSNAGCAYVLTKNSSNEWIQQAKLIEANSFGTSLRVAMGNNKVVLGNSQRLARLYEFNSANQWSLTKTFNGVNIGLPGSGVSVIGNTIAFSTGKEVHLFYKDWGGINNWGKIQAIKTSEVVSAIALGTQNLVLDMPNFSTSPGMGSVSFYKINSIVQPASIEVNLSIGTKDVQINKEIELPLTVSKFENISNAQLTIQWDPTIAEFKDIIDPVFGAQMIFDQQQVATGKLKLNWSSLNGTGVSLDDGSTFFTMKFKGIGSPGASSPVKIEQNSATFTRADQQVVQLMTSQGAVTMNPFLPVLLIAPEMTTKKNAQLLVPISVKHFKELVGMQFTFAWDPDVLAYDGAQQFNVPGLDQGSFGEMEIDNGKLTLSWTSIGLVPETLPDNTNLFFLKFNVVGNPGATTSFEILEVIEIIGSGFILRDYEVDQGSLSIDQFALIHGTVKHNGNLLPGVMIKAALAGSFLGYTDTTVGGSYSMSIGAGFNYSMSAAKSTDNTTYLTYLNAADLAAVQRHILKTEILTDPLKLKAADVNHSTTITTFDKVLIEGVILGMQDFPNHEQWKFLPVGYQNADPFAYPADQVINDVIEDLTLEYQAIHFGDVVNSQEGSVGRTETTSYTFAASVEKNETNGEVSAIVKSSGFENVSALQAAFQWNDLEFLSLEPRGIAPKTSSSDNSLRLVWDESHGKSESFVDGSPLFVLKFKPNSEFALQDKLTLSSALKPEAYNSQLKSSEIKLAWSSNQDFDFSIGPPYPNPFSENIKLNVTLTSPSEIRYQVFDVLGKEIFVNSFQGKSGINTVLWHGDTNNGSIVSKGVYFIKLKVGTYLKIVKVIKD